VHAEFRIVNGALKTPFPDVPAKAESRDRSLE
jgi:hypothetical protein